MNALPSRRGRDVLATRHDLVDAQPVEIDDLETPAIRRYDLADARQPLEGVDHETRGGLVVTVLALLQPEQLRHLVERHAAVE